MIVSCTVLTYITWASAREFGTHRISICVESQEPSLLVYTIYGVDEDSDRNLRPPSLEVSALAVVYMR